MSQFKIEGIRATGLKGGDWSVEFDAQTVFITGPNGFGKSRIRNAVEFVFGLKVEGAASANGTGIIGMVAGDLLAVEMDLSIDGKRHTIGRGRRFEKGTFKASVITIDGVVSNAEGITALIGGDVAINPGAALLDSSADALRAELARLALILAAKRPTTVQAPEFDGMPTTAEGLSKEREARKKAVNEANAALRSAQQSLDASVRNAPDAPARPEQVEAVKAQAAQAREAHAAWAVEHGKLTAQRDNAENDQRKWLLDANRATAILQSLQTSLRLATEGAEGATVESAQAEIAAITKEIETAETECSFAEDDRASVRESHAKAVADKATTAEKLAAANKALEALSHDTCPTCEQAVGACVVETFRGVVADCQNVARGAAEVFTAVQTRLTALNAEVADYGAKITKLRGALAAAQKRLGFAESVSGAQAKVAEAEKALAEIRAARPATAEGLAAQVSESEKRRPDVAGFEAKIAKLAAESEAQKRLISDQAVRDAAEKAATAAKAALKSLDTYEESLVGSAAKEIEATANQYLGASGLRVSLSDGPVTLEQTTTGERWFGVGLSRGQRVTLEAALSEAVFDLTDARLRLSMVEADDLEGPMLAGLIDALEGAVGFGTLHLGAVITCHDPGHRAGWQRIGPDAPAPVQPVQLVPEAITYIVQRADMPAEEIAEALESVRDWQQSGGPRLMSDAFDVVAEAAPEDDDAHELIANMNAAVWARGVLECIDDDVSGSPIDAHDAHDAAVSIAAAAERLTDDAVVEAARVPCVDSVGTTGYAFDADSDVQTVITTDTGSDSTPATAKELAAALAEDGPSTDALRAILGDMKRKLTAGALKRLIVEKYTAQAITIGAFDTLVAAACEAHPKRAYNRKAGDDAAPDGETTDDQAHDQAEDGAE